MKMDLPKFKYHPDPLKSGSIVRSENECECCGKKRG
ncbi:MAG: CbrC family protein, partial [Bacteroidales bacterium]|nr:CbrC family protein [Bacteroidales bacterium]